MKHIRLISALVFISFSTFGQSDSTGKEFSLGMRSTVSTFTDAGSAGIGAGGQFWIRVSRHLNTVWYADFINTNVQNLGYRRDGHIGWSVIFYMNQNPLKLHTVTPFIMAGQCFDYTKVYSDYLNVSAERWSAAAPQGGFGLTYRLTSHFDFSAFVLYMLHLGTHVESEIVTDEYGVKYLYITKEPGASIDGHLLITLSVNYLLGRF
ncbi:MAG TPA: hypothetical protein VK806_04880 [Bacteroidia bacterium]|jgi:hypothetical protein|nr:hypothetical protein [Bacteroidia bacterium]